MVAAVLTVGIPAYRLAICNGIRRQGHARGGLASSSQQARATSCHALTQVPLDAVLAEHVPALGDDHILLPLVAHVAVDHGTQRGILGLHMGVHIHGFWDGVGCTEAGDGLGKTVRGSTASRLIERGVFKWHTALQRPVTRLQFAVACRR